MEEKDLRFIQRQIGYEFENADLLQQAFVRRSYSKENGGEDNEVLEFIGDKVLDFVVVKLLIEKYGFFIGDCEDFDPNEEFDEFACDKSEAKLTELKKILIQKRTLAERIDALDLADYLIMGRGDIQNNVKEENSVKEDLFEAVVGAVALDSDWDMEEMQNVVEIMLAPDNYLQNDTEDNYVELIQNWTLRRYGMVPQYCFEKTIRWRQGCVMSLSSSCPFQGKRVVSDNSIIYCNNVIVNGDSIPEHTCWLKLGELDLVFKGCGKSKGEARNAVCKLAYRELEKRDLLFSICDEIENPNKDNAINQLEILARRGYFSIPIYEFNLKYSRNGNPVWKCDCYIKEKDNYFYAEAPSKKDAKKSAAFEMLKYVLEADEKEAY